MMTIAETSALLAVFNPQDSHHERCSSLFHGTGGFVYSPLVIAELDHMVRQHVCHQAAQQAYVAILDRVTGPEASDFLGQLTTEDHIAARDLRNKYADLRLHLTDCFAVALARDWGTNQIFTVEDADFRRLAPLPGADTGFDYFRILPTDL